MADTQVIVLRSAIRRLAFEVVTIKAYIDKHDDGLRDEIRAMSSLLTSQIDGFMSNVGKIDRAQVIADWRATELEKRVDVIEKRPS